MPTSRICCSDQPIFSKHVADQDSLRLGLLAVPPGRDLVERIRETAGQDGGLSPHDLGALLRMPPRSLIEQYTQGESGRALRLQEEVALTALRENLPRALQWKAVVDLASELGLHRNHIQSQVEQFGKEGMLMLARNNIMYISPLGEELVRERYPELETIEHLPSVSEVAQALGISPNMAHAFFAKKRESLALDIHGRARLIPAQVEELEQWRSSIDNIRARTDLTIWPGSRCAPVFVGYGGGRQGSVDRKGGWDTASLAPLHRGAVVIERSWTLLVGVSQSRTTQEVGTKGGRGVSRGCRSSGRICRVSARC